MDVDSDMLVERVPIQKSLHSQDIPLDTMRNISVTDVDSSRRLVEEFMSNHTAYELFPDSGKIVALDISLPIKQAFHILYEQGITEAPLWDSNQQQFVGMLTASDFISILMQIKNQHQMLSAEELENHTIAAWRNVKFSIKTGTCQANSLQYAGPDHTLKSVVKLLLHHEATAVPVLHFSVDDLALPHLLHLASLSGVLKCLCRHFQHFSQSLPLLNLPIGSLSMGTWRGEVPNSGLVVLRATDSLIAVLTLLMQANISAVPIVDQNGSLVDIFAKSYITAFARENAYINAQLENLTIKEALSVVHNGQESTRALSVLRSQICLRTDSLRSVLEQLAKTGMQQVICVEAGTGHVEGLITLTDIFGFLLP